jgi:hypothetical protein
MMRRSVLAVAVYSWLSCCKDLGLCSWSDRNGRCVVDTFAAEGCDRLRGGCDQSEALIGKAGLQMSTIV